MLFSEARQVFLLRCESERLSSHTLKAYSTDTRQFEAWTCNPELQNLGKEDVLRYHELLVEKGFQQATIKRKFAALKAMFAFLEREEALSVNPMRSLHLKLRLPKQLPKNIPKSEIRRLFRQAKKARVEEGGITPGKARLRTSTTLLSIELMLCTGVRVGELVGISIADLDLPSARIKINGKGSRERFVFLPNNEVSHHLEDYILQRSILSPLHDFLFVNGRGMPASTQYIRKLIRDLTESANIPRRITPHMFRHSAASELVESGVDIRFIQKLLGHQSISTTEIYTHLNDNSLLKSLRKADILNSLS